MAIVGVKVSMNKEITIHELAEQYLRGALRKDAELMVFWWAASGDGAHRLTNRVERVDLAKRLLGVTLPDRLVVST